MNPATSRRTFILGSTSLLATGSALYAASPEWVLRYSPSWNIGLPLGDCADIDRTAAELRAIRERVKNDTNFVRSMVADQVRLRDQLVAESETITGTIDSLTSQEIIQKIAIVVGISLAAAGFIVATPYAFAAVLGLQIIAGTTFFGLQAAYSSSQSAPDLVFAYGKDRTFTLGSAVADNAGSAGGKVLSSALSVVSVAIDVYGLSGVMNDKEQLKRKLREATSKASEISSQITNYEKRPVVLWKAYFDNILEGTIESLERFSSENQDTNCRITRFVGPAITQP